MVYKELNQQTLEDIKRYFQDRDYTVIAVPRLEALRVYTVRATKSVQIATRIHGLDKERAQVLGSLLVSALLLTSSLKHATNQKVLVKLNLQDGVVVAEADATGKVRGFVEGSLQKPWMGTLTVVKELRLGTPYTSIVPIVSNELKDNLLYYFEKSEQVKTALDISVDFDQEGVVKTASGYLVQILGGAEETSVRFVEEIIKRTINMQARPEDMAYSILEGKEPRLIGLKEVEYYCPCNEEIARSTLFLLEEEELEEIFSEGPAEVVCKFCGRVYRFTKDLL